MEWREEVTLLNKKDKVINGRRRTRGRPRKTWLQGLGKKLKDMRIRVSGKRKQDRNE